MDELGMVVEITPEKDAVIVRLVEGKWFVYIECLNEKNKDLLVDAAKHIQRSI